MNAGPAVYYYGPGFSKLPVHLFEHCPQPLLAVATALLPTLHAPLVSDVQEEWLVQAKRLAGFISEMMCSVSAVDYQSELLRRVVFSQ